MKILFETYENNNSKRKKKKKYAKTCDKQKFKNLESKNTKNQF